MPHAGARSHNVSSVVRRAPPSVPCGWAASTAPPGRGSRWRVEIFGSLPPWAVVMLALLLGGILLAQNVGWLLAAKAQLDAHRGKADARRARPAGDARGPRAPR